jgi:tetratricopeptide (TPR) repeat protein/DNA-binding CsgD family transcriptional regulator
MNSENDLPGALKFCELNPTGLQSGNGRRISNGSSGPDLSERLERAIKEAKSLEEDDAELPSLLLEIGSLHSRLGHAPQARLWLARSLTTARALADRTITGRALVALGMLEARDGDLGVALDHFNEVLDQDVEPRMLGVAWMEIGVVHAGAGEVEPADACFQRSLQLFESCGDQLNALRAMVNIANVNRARGEFEQALELMLEVMMEFEELDEQAQLFEALVIIADIYRRTGELDTALVYATRAWSIAQQLGDRSHDAKALICIGDIYRMLGHYREAITALGYALEIAVDRRDPQLEYQIHEVLSLTHEAAGDPAAALAHQKKMISLREEHIRQTSRRSLDAMRARVANELKQGEEFRREAHQLRGEVAEKQRELTSLALSLVQKSEILNELKVQLRDLLSSAHDRTEAMITPVLKNLVESKGPEESWQVFEQQFNTVHRDFMKNLAERYPTLTPMELKLCALTRIDLSTKDIAHLLFVSVRNVQNHRYRLRKKFGLASEENLTLFLTAI